MSDANGRTERGGRIVAVVSGYAATVLVSAVVSLAIIPVIIFSAGDRGWAAIAVGQSVGSIAAVLTALGWGITGPAMVARAGASDRAQIVANSVVSRLWLSLLILPVAGLTAWLTTPAYQWPALLAAVNVATVGLGLAWYFVGIGSPRQLLLMDTLPRAAGTVFGGLVLWVTESLELFGVVQLSFSCAAVAIACYCATRRFSGSVNWTWSWRWSVSQVRQQLLPSTTAIATSLYGALPTLSVAWLAPLGVGQFALAERLGRYVTMAVTPVHNWMQGWVPAGDPSSVRPRIRTVVWTAVFVGVGCSFALYMTGPLLAKILGGGAIFVDTWVILGVAVSVGMTTISRCTGSACLIALRASKSVAFSSFAGAIVCVSVLGAFVPAWGAGGAAFAMAAAETAVALYQAIALTHLLRQGPRKRKLASKPDIETITYG